MLALVSRSRCAWLGWGLAGGWLPMAACQAAGGHFAVDDAAVLEQGQCQVEVWREQSPALRGWHAGPACRVGFLELGLNLDQHEGSGQPKRRMLGPQLKWAHDWHPMWSVGLAWSASRQSPVETGTPHFQGQQWLGLLTWRPDPMWQVHFNQGAARAPGGPLVARTGLAVETQWHPRWSTTAEWFDDRLAPLVRVGLRHQFDAHWSLDLGRAQIRREGTRWTVGLNGVWDR